MIFVTVGAQMPFDRLIKAVDLWAGKGGRSDIFAQIGKSQYCPSNIQWVNFLDPQEYKNMAASAEVIVAHAGTGSILTALQFGKPILVMPRRADLSETRNDHQVATSRRFNRFDSVVVAWDENELPTKLAGMSNLRESQKIGFAASHELIGAIKEFINK